MEHFDIMLNMFSLILKFDGCCQTEEMPSLMYVFIKQMMILQLLIQFHIDNKKLSSIAFLSLPSIHSLMPNSHLTILTMEEKVKSKQTENFH